MCPNNELLQRERMQEELIAAPRQMAAAPQQIMAAPEQMEVAAGQRFAQPVNVRAAAPAPEVAQMPRQQQMSRKEMRARRKEAEKRAKEAEKRRREEAKRRAETKIYVDNLVAQMKANPIPGEDATDYQKMRPTELFSNRAEYLERVVLTQIGDERKARALLDEVHTLSHQAAIYDQAAHDFRFRNQNVPVYIEDVLRQKVPADVEKLLFQEALEFSNASYGTEMIKLYSAVEKKIFDQLSEEQKAQATSKEMRKGALMEEYNRTIEQMMQQHHLTRNEAKRRYAEEKVREKRPVTLRKLEQQRKAHFEDDSPNGLQYWEGIAFCSLKYANEDIQKAHPGAPELDWKQASDMTAEYIRDATKKLSYELRVPNCKIMAMVLESRRFKTQMETKTSGAALAQDVRKQFTKDSFGVDPETLPPEQFEIYGYASHGDLVKESKKESIVGQGVGQYGQVVVTLKKDRMINRTTMTVGDSLDARKHARPNWVDKPDLLAVSAKARMTLIEGAYEHKLRKQENPDHEVDLENLLKDAEVGYMELQYHGGVAVEDIESVTLIADYITEDGVEVEKEMPQELVEQLKSLGIQAKIVKDGKEYEL